MPKRRESTEDAGITDKLWSVDDIVALVEASEPKPGKRGSYKKKAA